MLEFTDRRKSSGCDKKGDGNNLEAIRTNYGQPGKEDGRSWIQGQGLRLAVSPTVGRTTLIQEHG